LQDKNFALLMNNTSKAKSTINGSPALDVAADRSVVVIHNAGECAEQDAPFLQ
jgi:hypothetical protein